MQFKHGLWANNVVSSPKMVSAQAVGWPVLGVRMHTHCHLPHSFTSTDNKSEVNHGLHVPSSFFLRSSADSLCAVCVTENSVAKLKMKVVLTILNNDFCPRNKTVSRNTMQLRTQVRR